MSDSRKRKRDPPFVDFCPKRAVGGFQPAAQFYPLYSSLGDPGSRTPKYRMSKQSYTYKPKKSANDSTTQRFQPKGPEKKCIDQIGYDRTHVFDGVQTNAANYTTVLTCPQVAQGTAFYERIGKRILLNKMHARFQFDVRKTGAGATTLDGWVRLVCYIDYQSNGGTATATDLLTVADGSGAFSVYGYRNMAQSTRFRTLVDEWIPMSELHTGDAPYVVREYNFRLNKLPIYYSGSLGQVPEFSENGIKWALIAFSPTGVAVGDTLTLHYDFFVRTRFTDS